MISKEIIDKKTWLPKCDLELYGQYLYRFKGIKYGTLDWNNPSFIEFCKQNNIQPKGTSAKREQRNHFWFSANIPKNQKTNDIAHHFLRHIRNAYAHCNIRIAKEEKNVTSFIYLRTMK